MDMQQDATRPENRPETAVDNGALDALAVAPPPPAEGSADDRAMTEVRDGMDAGQVKGLRRNPSDEDSKLEVALDETFPSSDAPSNTQPGKGKDPAPSSGFDPQAEAARAGQQ